MGTSIAHPVSLNVGTVGALRELAIKAKDSPSKNWTGNIDTEPSADDGPGYKVTLGSHEKIGRLLLLQASRNEPNPTEKLVISFDESEPNGTEVHLHGMGSREKTVRSFSGIGTDRPMPEYSFLELVKGHDQDHPGNQEASFVNFIACVNAWSDHAGDL